MMQYDTEHCGQASTFKDEQVLATELPGFIGEQRQ
jgi:hypothetical protein